MKNIPQEYWSRAHHWLIWHGRKVCIARKPKCDICPVKEYCKAYNLAQEKAE
jgi:endonuclease-3